MESKWHKYHKYWTQINNPPFKFKKHADIIKQIKQTEAKQFAHMLPYDINYDISRIIFLAQES